MSYIQECNRALREMLARDPNAVVCGQLVKWGTAGLTEGLNEEQLVTYPVSEALMNASAMGFALAGSRCVMIHERMDFVAVAMDALINHIPIWPMKCGVELPLTIIGIVGKGKGCYTLIQGVTAPLNCRVFINPRSYVLISSSIPLCHLQLSDKHFRKI
jgi:pyruvate dehydrogenase E1 component beta subunit